MNKLAIGLSLGMASCAHAPVNLTTAEHDDALKASCATAPKGLYYNPKICVGDDYAGVGRNNKVAECIWGLNDLLETAAGALNTEKAACRGGKLDTVDCQTDVPDQLAERTKASCANVTNDYDNKRTKSVIDNLMQKIHAACACR